MAAGDNAVRVFECTEGQWTLQATAEAAHDQDVNCVCWHPADLHCLASCSDDGTIKLWRYQSGAQNACVTAAADAHATIQSFRGTAGSNGANKSMEVDS